MKKVLRIVSFCFATFLFLASSLPVSALAKIVSNIDTEQTLLASIDVMLAQDRAPGEIVFS